MRLSDTAYFGTKTSESSSKTSESSAKTSEFSGCRMFWDKNEGVLCGAVSESSETAPPSPSRFNPAHLPAPLCSGPASCPLPGPRRPEGDRQLGPRLEGSDSRPGNLPVTIQEARERGDGGAPLFRLAQVGPARRLAAGPKAAAHNWVRIRIGDSLSSQSCRL